MKGDVCLPGKAQIARVILAYLEKHPDAQDTLEGIAQNWLPDRGSQYDPTAVREVVKDLVLVGKILESKRPGLPAMYRCNLDRRSGVNGLLKKKAEDE